MLTFTLQAISGNVLGMVYHWPLVGELAVNVIAVVSLALFTMVFLPWCASGIGNRGFSNSQSECSSCSVPLWLSYFFKFSSGA